MKQREAVIEGLEASIALNGREIKWLSEMLAAEKAERVALEARSRTHPLSQPVTTGR